MKHKIFLPLIFLILTLFALIATNLYITGTVFSDMRHLLLEQRTISKNLSMRRISIFFNHNPEAILNAVEKSQIEPYSANFIAIYNPEENYPIIDYYSPTNTLGDLSNIASIGDMKFMDSLGIQNFENKLIKYKQSDNNVYEIKGLDGEYYLLTWIIIPSPLPNGAQYVYCAFTDIKHILVDLKDTELYYRSLFVSTLGLLAIMLVLIPVSFRRLESWTSGKPYKS